MKTMLKTAAATAALAEMTAVARTVPVVDFAEAVVEAS